MINLARERETIKPPGGWGDPGGGRAGPAPRAVAQSRLVYAGSGDDAVSVSTASPSASVTNGWRFPHLLLTDAQNRTSLRRRTEAKSDSLSECEQGSADQSLPNAPQHFVRCLSLQQATTENGSAPVILRVFSQLFDFEISDDVRRSRSSVKCKGVPLVDFVTGGLHRSPVRSSKGKENQLKRRTTSQTLHLLALEIVFAIFPATADRLAFCVPGTVVLNPRDYLNCHAADGFQSLRRRRARDTRLRTGKRRRLKGSRRRCLSRPP
uniref:Uncharacterized protein n=1 Tax=Branchiostoma floridae TaxID=7739 RepID=C3ZJ76_BRAFL|eukprot:XP_002591396.1 hypothetical protein BRAFLDRAFT_86914 [Branchiostoma floridae]